MRSSSADAEADEDDIEIPDTQSPSLQNDLPDDPDDLDAEADPEDPDDESEIVGPVKRAPRRSRTGPTRKSRDHQDDDDDEEQSQTDAEHDSDSSSESTSNNENAWAGESDTAEEADVDVTAQNRCVYVAQSSFGHLQTDRRLGRFCGEDEENDPSDEFEEYLACSVCGDHCRLK